MTRHRSLKQLGFLGLGLVLALMLVGPQGMGAMAPTPGQILSQQSQTGFGGPIQLAPPPQFTKIHAWRSAGGIVDVQVELANANSVQLIMPGTITLKSHKTYVWGDVYHFGVSGLTPDTLYNYEVDATGAWTTIHATGSVWA